ncbi:MAG: methyltransferase domain-containing protein [Candidatus Eremiobacteraeota bacterium]|nr:methyltransferase domain-containing protein [Candidatus Eremiobacteraeota bacterium]MCW5869399.1 methyltransferase domain-containing protein [Candidatus Eremiobacteraeota bacterium]
MMDFQECFQHFQPDSRILDVGCGIGDLSSQMARCVPQGQVLGVDSSYQDIVLAGRRFAGQANLRFRAADARTLRFKEEPFDFVVSRSCLHYLERPGQSFPVMARHLRPGGSLHAWFPGQGHAAEINQTLNFLLGRPDWSNHFRDFRPRGVLVTPAACSPWLAHAGLRKNDCRLIPKSRNLHPVADVELERLLGASTATTLAGLHRRFPGALPSTQNAGYRAELVWLALDATKHV